MAKNLIAQSLMQHATVKVPGAAAGGSTLRDRMQAAKSGGNAAPVITLPVIGTAGSSKSRTADPSTIRAYAEHMAIAKMTPQERWENAKQAEQDVQNWEKSKKNQEAQKQMEDANNKKSREVDTENKKKEIHEKLNTSLTRGKVRDYRETMAQYKQARLDTTNT